MAIDTSAPRTRRALLAAAVGAGAASVAASIGRPLPARAANGNPLTLGEVNDATSTTWVLGSGVTDDLGAAAPVFGVESDAVGGIAVEGTVRDGTGIHGDSAYGVGVYGTAVGGQGVGGFSVGGPGIRGGTAFGTGVVGSSGWGADEAGPKKVGVYGYAVADASCRGVFGRSTSGRGVDGQATSGTGVYASATTGYALRAVGRVKLDKCAGTATIAAGADRVTVNPGIDLVPTSAVVATLQGNAGSTSTAVSRVSLNASTNRFEIILTKAATQNVKVAWIVLG